jgi:hypothetical protein
MKKMISILLSVLLILPFGASFGIPSAAEATYAELWERKRAYETENRYVSLGMEYIVYVCYGDDYGEGGDNYGYGWAFILFTEQGKKLTYNYEKQFEVSKSENGYWLWRGVPIEGEPITDYWSWEDEYVFTCLELREWIETCYDKAYPGHSSPYRNVVQSLGVTADELKEAYRKMKEEPEFAREILSYMTDEEFAQFASYLKERDVPPDFVIEAACHDDDVEGEMLLAVPGNVYVKEWDCTISCCDIFPYPEVSMEELAKCNLTTDSFRLFMSDMEQKISRLLWHGDYTDEQGRNLIGRYEYLVSEMNRQLAAAETGDSAVQGVIVLALAIPALAATFILRRKKRI